MAIPFDVRNSKIGANSLLKHSIPEYELWFGTPAKFVRNLTPD